MFYIRKALQVQPSQDAWVASVYVSVCIRGWTIHAQILTYTDICTRICVWKTCSKVLTLVSLGYDTCILIILSTFLEAWTFFKINCGRKVASPGASTVYLTSHGFSKTQTRWASKNAASRKICFSFTSERLCSYSDAVIVATTWRWMQLAGVSLESDKQLWAAGMNAGNHHRLWSNWLIGLKTPAARKA